MIQPRRINSRRGARTRKRAHPETRLKGTRTTLTTLGNTAYLVQLPTLSNDRETIEQVDHGHMHAHVHAHMHTHVHAHMRAHVQAHLHAPNGWWTTTVTVEKFDIVVII